MTNIKHEIKDNRILLHGKRASLCIDVENKRNINIKIKYIRFLMYLLFRFTYRLLLGKEKNIKIIRYYVDGIRGVIDSKYPFIVIEND